MAGGTRHEHLRLLVMDKLANDQQLQQLVGTRVSDQHPDRNGGDALFPCITTWWRGGHLLALPIVQRSDFDLCCYSRISQGEAAKIYDAAVAVLQNERLSIAGVPTVASCNEQGRPADGYDPAARVWMTRGRWVARAAGTSS